MTRTPLKSKNISLKAKGLLMVISEFDAPPTLDAVSACCKESRNSISSTLMELEATGLVKKIRDKTADGRFAGVRYEVIGRKKTTVKQQNGTKAEKKKKEENKHEDADMNGSILPFEFKDNTFIELKYGKGKVSVPQSYVDNLKPCYPFIDVEDEVRNAASWTILNENETAERKEKDWKAFLRGWLRRSNSRAQENRNGQGPSRSKVKDHTEQYEEDRIGVVL